MADYGYLPKQLIECVLKFYNDKTQLKNVEGKEKEYLSGKEMLNSCYGMCVTSPINDDINFNNGEWSSEKVEDITTALEKAYKNNKQFLVYQWGVWVTAWARYELFKGIKSINNDVIYCDTDSIKFLDINKHIDFINKYNIDVVQEIYQTLDFYNIDRKLATPKTIKGIEKPLGVWDIEKGYTQFKTLGAKRYCYTQGDINTFNITVSGINKEKCVPYILDECKKHNISPFDYFNNGMEIDDNFTGKMTHTYIDTPIEFLLKDYTGIQANVKENSFIHLEKASFSMSLSGEFMRFLYDYDITKMKNKIESKKEKLML